MKRNSLILQVDRDPADATACRTGQMVPPVTLAAFDRARGSAVSRSRNSGGGPAEERERSPERGAVKLIKQVSLLNDSGNQEKIYEIDLCEVGADQFVVNFRFGPKGGNLRDGSKTVVPVPEAEAQRIFDKMVQRQLGKGFYDSADPKPTPQAPTAAKKPRSTTFDPKARADALVTRLEKKTKWRLFGGTGSAYPVSRAAWRAGVLKIEEAGKPLADILADAATSSNRPLNYSTIWALARAEHKDSAAALKEHAERWVTRTWAGGDDDPIGRVAAHAYTLLASDGDVDVLRSRAKGELPLPLSTAMDSGDADAFVAAFKAHWEANVDGNSAVVDLLQLLDGEAARAGVMSFAREAPLKTPHWRRLRHLFKMAELRDDAELYGLLAHRLEKTKANFRMPRWGSYAYIDGDYLDVKAELKKNNSRAAYGSTTRRYLRHRAWRTLRKLGEAGDPTYVKMAVGMLLPFTDGDHQNPRRTSYYDWNSRRTIEKNFDGWAPYWAFNHVLFENSPRIELQRGAQFFNMKRGFKPGDKAPTVREEAFPELWDQVPQGLVHLLLESGCEAVHDFAVKALRANEKFLEQLPTEVLVELLRRPYVVTARLAFELAKDRYDANNPDLLLVGAMATCPVADARKLAFEWIAANRAAFTQDAEFIATLLLSPYDDTQDASKQLLAAAVLSKDVAQAVIGRLIAHLLEEWPKAAPEVDARKKLCDTVMRVFPQELRTISLDVVRDLLGHKLAPVQELGAQILLGHDVRPKDLPEELITQVMNSEHAQVRTIGVRLFGELPDDVLKDRAVILVGLCTSPKDDVRNAVRPVLQRLASDVDFAADIATLLVRNLLRAERFEGVHTFLLTMLKADFVEGLRTINEEIVWRLLQAESSAAQSLGGELLKTNVEPSELTLRRIAALGSHEILSVREACWSMYEAQTERVANELGEAIRVLDAKWDDTREWAFGFFKEKIPKDAYDPKTLIAIADSVRDDVQGFGRELITSYFEDEHGDEYLLKLSEHPSMQVQMFVTNYLARYAAGDVDKITKLRHYFQSVLSRVNAGRVAKARVMHFLRTEAKKSEAAATVIAGILARQSNTVAILDKSATVEAMLELHELFPDVEVPIKIKPIEVRE
jgi:hypothetical protein